MLDGPTRERWVDGLQWALGADDANPASIFIDNPEHTTICNFFTASLEDEYNEEQPDITLELYPCHDADRHSKLVVMAPKLWLGLKEATDVLEGFRDVPQLSSLGLSVLVDTLRALLDEAVPEEDHLGNS